MLKGIVASVKKNTGMFIMTVISVLSGIITIACGWTDFYNNFLSKSITVSVLGIILMIFAAGIVLKIILSYCRAGNGKQMRYPEILGFNASYRKTDWKLLFGMAEHSVTICSFYLDTFLVWTKNDMEQFFKKDNTKLTVIVSDYCNEENLTMIARLFPQYSRDVVKNKIIKTESKIIDILNKIKVSADKFDYCVYDNFLNYSYILIDERYLYLSIYEMEREIKMDSPALVFDLDMNQDLKDYFLKENSAILQKAKIKNKEQV